MTSQILSNLYKHLNWNPKTVSIHYISIDPSMLLKVSVTSVAHRGLTVSLQIYLKQFALNSSFRLPFSGFHMHLYYLSSCAHTLPHIHVASANFAFCSVQGFYYIEVNRCTKFKRLEFEVGSRQPSVAPSSTSKHIHIHTCIHQLTATCVFACACAYLYIFVCMCACERLKIDNFMSKCFPGDMKQHLGSVA